MFHYETQAISDKGKNVWIETVDGYRELNGATINKSEFSKWMGNTSLEVVFVIPEDGRQYSGLPANN